MSPEAPTTGVVHSARIYGIFTFQSPESLIRNAPIRFIPQWVLAPAESLPP